MNLHDWLRQIKANWEMDTSQFVALLHVSEKTFEKWFEQEARLSTQGTIPPGLETAAPLIAVYRKLASQFPKPEDQVAWLFTPHRDFGDQKPVDVMASSIENLYWIGYYLDSSSALKASPMHPLN